MQEDLDSIPTTAKNNSFICIYVLVLPEIVLEGIFNTILDRKNNEKNQERK
jgi:hypothetical protein